MLCDLRYKIVQSSFFYEKNLKTCDTLNSLTFQKSVDAKVERRHFRAVKWRNFNVS